MKRDATVQVPQRQRQSPVPPLPPQALPKTKVILPKEEVEVQAHHRFIWLSIVIATAFWVFESVVHRVIFNNGFEFIPLTANELWMRSLVCALIIGFGVYAHRQMVRRIRQLKIKRQLEMRLTDTLTKVLSGYIPICAHCRRIRDVDDEWIEFERYIYNHTTASFTHGVCPACAHEHYGHLADELD